MNSTTTTPSGETDPITTQLTTLLALLSLLACSILATLAIALILALTGTLNHLMYLFNISIGIDKDETFTPEMLKFLFDMDVLTAVCIGIELGPGYRDLGVEDWRLESLCRIGWLVVVAVPQGFIEGRIVCRGLKQGREWLDGWEGYTKNGGLGGVADGKIEMATENKTLAEV
jgi:hypothetical protein